ncbi:MAG: helix-turn-helix domain-containing protein [Clostridiales bacterium]|nr:helix-turn-helix domain-containing protein [Clostridiales bacterium]
MYKANFDDREQLRQFIADNILDTAQVSAMLGCSRQYVAQLVKEGKLLPIKETINHRLFLRADVEERIQTG